MTAEQRKDSAVVLRLWNRTEAIETSLPRLRAIAQNYAGEDLGVLASTLVELDEVWRGCVPAGSWLSDNAPIPRTPMQTSRPLRHVAGAVLLAQSLSAAMSGQFNSRQHEIEEIASTSSLREYHFRWLAHFSAARAALMCGNLSRAKLEWKHLLHDFPRFIPCPATAVCRRVIRRVKDGLRGGLRAASRYGRQPCVGGRSLPHWTPPARDIQKELLHDSARDHSQSSGSARHIFPAAEARNPVELSRIADEAHRLRALGTERLTQSRPRRASRSAAGAP